MKYGADGTQDGFSKEEQLLLEEYRMLGQVWIYEGTLFWQRFNVFAAINAGALALAGNLIVKELELDPKTVSASCAAWAALWLLLALGGILLSAFWLVSSARARAYHAFWLAGLRSIEEKLPPLKIVTLGREHFKKGGTDFGGRTGSEKVSWAARYIPVTLAAMSVPLAFLVMWVGITAIGLLVTCR